MNEITTFENKQFGELRTINKDGEPWFVASDVCKALDLGSTHKAVDRLDDDEKGRNSIPTLGGTQDMIVVNEPGLYSLILGSRKPEAKSFKRWITHEVLPSIRKNGGYIAGQEDPELTEDELVAKALQVVSRRLAEKEKQLQSVVEQNKALVESNNQKEERIQKLLPKATYYHQVLSCKDPIRTRVLAKDYGWSAQELNKWLEDHDIQYKQNGTWLLKQKYANEGYTIQQTYTYQDYWGTWHTQMHTSWTQAGRLFIYTLLKEHGILPNIEKHNDKNFDWDDIDDDLYGDD